MQIDDATRQATAPATEGGGRISPRTGLAAMLGPLFIAKNFLWFTAFVGANLFQSGFTRFCPAEMIMVKLGMKKGDGVSCGP